MNWINKQISKVSPIWALKREVAAQRLNRITTFKEKRSFNAISNNRLYNDILAPKNSADSAIKSSTEGLRNHVRQLEYNNGFVSGPIQRIVNNVVGTGFKFQSRIKSDDNFVGFPKITEKFAGVYNLSAEKAMKRWEKQADRRLMNSFGSLLRLAEGAILRDGAALVVGRDSKRKDRIIPYCQELLEIDRLQTPMSEVSNPKIRNGVEYDSEGVPKLYYILKYHPGDAIAGLQDSDYEQVDAYYPNGLKKVFHLFNPIRPEQSQGFSKFASALSYLQNLDRYHEAEIYAALEDACLTGFVKSPAAQQFQANYAPDQMGGSGDEAENRIHEFAPNKWHYLNPGEEVDIHSPNRPNSQFGEMTNQLLRGPANSLDIPPEVLTQNWQGMNYSNARTVLLMFHMTCRIRQNYLIENFCNPTWENVGTRLVIEGKLTAPGFDRRKDDYLSHGWIPPGWQWIDPQKEAKGKQIEVEQNFETLANIHASKGYDYEETLEQRARELRKIKELEKKYDISFQTPENQNIEKPENTEKDDNETDEESGKKSILSVV